MPESLEMQLANLSGEEMVTALGLSGAPAWVRRAGRAVFAVPSWPLGRVLARFDQRTGEAGIDTAARETLAGLGARWTATNPPPSRGPLLAVSNHPGAYDALALMAAIGRRDLLIVAADRRFLRALPHVSGQLLFVPLDSDQTPEVTARTASVRRALRHLRGGGALLHFPAGRIEPDPAFLGAAEEPLAPWHPSTGALVRVTAAAGGHVVTIVVSGVHSARAKRLLVTRLAERRGITTLAPLLQVSLPGFNDIDVRVDISPARTASTLLSVDGNDDDAAIARRLRGEAAERVREART